MNDINLDVASASTQNEENTSATDCDNSAAISELSAMQLAYVGGGSGSVIFF